MRRIVLLAALIVALGVTTLSAQTRNRDRVERRITQPGVYHDDRGSYQWQIIERRVWIPERRTSGLFGIGSRRIPGHYEIRTDRVKVYRNTRYGSQRKGWEGKHPHGMPPGQRKKLENHRYDDHRNNDRRYDRGDRNDSRYKGKNSRDRRD